MRIRRYTTTLAVTAAALALTGQPAAAATTNPPPYLRVLLTRYFPGEQHFAARVARCESGYNPRATGRAGERGIFQIHPSWAGRRIGRYTVNFQRLYDAQYNTMIAAELRRVGGWGHWTCARMLR